MESLSEGFGRASDRWVIRCRAGGGNKSVLDLHRAITEMICQVGGAEELASHFTRADRFHRQGEGVGLL